jgi:transposase-like protein
MQTSLQSSRILLTLHTPAPLPEQLLLAFPADLRRIVYTTNTIEALNRQIRKHVKTRGSFPTQDSARKLLYLTIQNAEHNWRRAYNWSAALAALKIHFGDRLPDTAS